MTKAVVLALIVVAAVATAGPAMAHDPLFLTSEQTTPQTGPFLPDGTISFAIYGDLTGPGDSRGMQVGFEAGDRLLIELLIPALAPEADLEGDQLPVATVVAPDGTETLLVPTQRERFDEPFSSTSYFRLARLESEAQAGVYDIVVVADAPARFTVAVGTVETFLTPVERVENRATSFAGFTEPLARWYAGTGTAVETTTEVAEPVVDSPPASTHAQTPTPPDSTSETAAAPTPIPPDPTSDPTAEPADALAVALAATNEGNTPSAWLWVAGIIAFGALGLGMTLVLRR